jgi:pimeloyl-ACP methyl ester carboxylesterase
MSGDRDRPALVFVHGGAHSGRCWDQTISAISELVSGVRILATDMPGRREVAGDLASLTIQGCARSLSEQVQRWHGPGEQRRIVLIGHSIAGVVLPELVDQLGTDRVQQVIFVASCVPPPGACVIDTLPFGLKSIARRIIGRSRVINTVPPGVVRFFFSNSATPDQCAAIAGNICPESSALFTSAPTTPLPPAVRRSWILPTRDRVMPPSTQRQFIARLGGVDPVICIDAGHEVMITHARELAAQIVALACP